MLCDAQAQRRPGWPGPCEYVNAELFSWPTGWRVAPDLPCLHPNCDRKGWVLEGSPERILPFCCLRCNYNAVQGTESDHGGRCSGEVLQGVYGLQLNTDKTELLIHRDHPTPKLSSLTATETPYRLLTRLNIWDPK